MRRKIVAGNWKMNGSKDLVKQLVGAVREQSGSVGEDVEVVVVPPAIYLGQVAEQGGERITTGVQNVSQWQSGAYTGEISAEMARDMGCGYVLVGHSERRQLFGERQCLRENFGNASAENINMTTHSIVPLYGVQAFQLLFNGIGYFIRVQHF